MTTQKGEKETKIEGEAKPTEELRRPTPDVEADFEALLKDYGVPEKAALIVTKHVADTGSDKVFERPMELLEKLAKFPRQIPPVTRKNILDHWIAQNKIPVPEEYEDEAEKPAEEIRRRGAKEGKEEAKYSVDPETAAIRVATTTDKTALTWDEAEKLSQKVEKKQEEKDKKVERKVAYVYDTDTNTVRMAREGELGGTMEQAKELKKMAEESKGEEPESPFIADEKGNWTLNPKAKVTGVELMAFETIRKAQEKGEPVDPIDALSQAAEKMKAFREALGGTGAQMPEWISDPVKFLETVRGVSGTGEGKGLPEWMSNPLEFIKTVQGITGAGEGKSLPEWMSDPAKFLETIRNLSGGDKGDEALKQQVASLEKTLTDLREDRYKEQIEEQKKQLGTLTTSISDLKDQVADLNKPATGRSEMDILHEIATEGIGVLKTELPGFRRDVKDALGSTVLPPAKSAGERKERTTKLRQAVEKDKNIEEIGRRLFFNEG